MKRTHGAITRASTKKSWGRFTRCRKQSELCTTQILAMEFVEGEAIEQALSCTQEERNRLIHLLPCLCRLTFA